MDFTKLLPEKTRQNYITIRANPKLWAKFNLNIVKVVIGSVMLLIAWQFAKVILVLQSGSSNLSILGVLITFLVMVWVLYGLYAKGYKPIAARFNHYANIEQKPINIDIDKVVDDTLNKFDSGKRETSKKEGIK